MLLSVWDNIAKEAAAFMHMEQGTDSIPVVQSDSSFFASKGVNNIFRQLNKQSKKTELS